MKNCVYEEAVAGAARSGEWSDKLLEHSESCLVCAEVTLVATLLIDDAENLAAAESALPDPRVLWLRASLEKRSHATHRATLLISWMQRATLATVAGVLAFFAPNFLALLKETARQVVGSMTVPDLPATIAAPGVVLLLAFSVFALLALWNELAERS